METWLGRVLNNLRDENHLANAIAFFWDSWTGKTLALNRMPTVRRLTGLIVVCEHLRRQTKHDYRGSQSALFQGWDPTPVPSTNASSRDDCLKWTPWRLFA